MQYYSKQSAGGIKSIKNSTLPTAFFISATCSFKATPSYLLLRRSRLCVPLGLTDSIHCSPGTSRMQRLTCLHEGLTELGLVAPTAFGRVFWLLYSTDSTGDTVCQWNRTGRIWFVHPAQVSSHESCVTLPARCDFQASSHYFSVLTCRFVPWTQNVGALIRSVIM